MAGERIGKTYEALIKVVLDFHRSKKQLKGKVFWNETPEGLTVIPDFIIGPDKNHPDIVFMVTHSSSSKNSDMKCWRNIGELCEVKSVLNPTPLAINLVFDSVMKENLKSLQAAAFDGQLIIGDLEYGDSVIQWAKAHEDSLPVNQEEKAAAISQLISVDKQLSTVVSKLEKDISKTIQSPQTDLTDLWNLEKQRIHGVVPKPRITSVRRGLSKLLVFENLDNAILLYQGKKLQISDIPDYAYTIGLAKKTIGHPKACDSEIQNAIDVLPEDSIAFFDEDTNEYQLTHLGKVSSHCYLPPITAANFGQLMRDLLLDKPDGSHISQFAPIDYLIILCLVSEENKPFVRYRKTLKQKIDGWMEALPLEEKSYLYRTWIANAPDELLGSARVTSDRADAEKYVCQCTYTAMMIYDLSRGLTYSQINDYYGVDIEEIQEKVRDNAIWILCGFEQLLEVKSFYYHLKNNCEAETEQVQCVDAAFKRSSKQIFGLVADLKFRSRLGELVRGIKRVYPHADSYPGEGTIRKLEENGIIAIKDLIGKTPSELTTMGIRRNYADLICGYIRKRMA